MVMLGVIIFFFLGYFFFLSPPLDFEEGTVLEVEPGMSLHATSFELKRENVIRSRAAFEAFVILLGGEHRIISASYMFDTNGTVWQVARRMSGGEHRLPPVVATIPEGFNIQEIADVYAAKLPKFNKANFLSEAKEGYLFPDTYYFFNTDDEAKVIDSMSRNFEKKMLVLRPEIVSSGKTEREIIIMASVLEKEAEGDADRALIGGILWKRVSLGMKLQVDAAPETYNAKGLPKNPIGNPGMEAINAAIHPQSSGYLYYLHDKEGITHYAGTFAEHKKNIATYLK